MDALRNHTNWLIMFLIFGPIAPRSPGIESKAQERFTAHGKYLAHLRDLRERSMAEYQALGDSDPERAERVLRQYAEAYQRIALAPPPSSPRTSIRRGRARGQVRVRPTRFVLPAGST